MDTPDFINVDYIDNEGNEYTLLWSGIPSATMNSDNQRLAILIDSDGDIVWETRKNFRENYHIETESPNFELFN